MSIVDTLHKLNDEHRALNKKYMKAEAENAAFREALEFYARGHHFFDADKLETGQMAQWVLGKYPKDEK